MKTRYFTLNDLYNYINQNNSQNYVFSANSEDENIVVQLPGKIRYSEKEDPEGLFGITLYACHDQDNLNKSFIDTKDLEDAFGSFANKPILAYIHEVDGQDEFFTHNMHMEDDELVYDEVPVGIIPESNNIHFEHNDDNDKNYVVVDGYLYEDYSKAPDIVRRDGGCFCSAELSISEMSFDSSTKLLHLLSFSVSGITLLGKDEDGNTVNPGMEQAHVEISNFSKKENSMFSDDIREKLVELEEKLNSLTNLNINHNPKEKGGESVKKEFEAEEATAEVTEQAEVAAEEATEGVAEETSEETTEEAATEEAADETEETEEAAEEEKEEATEEDTQEEAPAEEEEKVEEKFSRTFELSHDDIRCGLYALLSQFEEEDNEWYGIVDVFDDYFIYQGFFDASHTFRQGYAKEGDNIQFSGDRVHLNAEYLTDNELAELNAIRSNYSEISEKLAKYEAEPQKMEKIESDEYSMIRETEEYQKVANDHFDLSVEEITKTLDDVVLKYAKANKLNYAANEEAKPVVARKLFAVGANGKRVGKYDSLFSK